MNYIEFLTALNSLKLFFKEQEKLDKVLKVISPSSTGVCEFGNKFVDDYIRILAVAVNDNNDWVSWFVFDNDFGKKGLEVRLKSEEKLHKIHTVKQLYNLIKEDK